MTKSNSSRLFKPVRNLALMASIFVSCLPSHADEIPQLTDNEFNSARSTGTQLVRDIVDQTARGVRGKRFAAVDCGRILVTEGDSWLDYPLYSDIVSELENRHWAVFSSARYGDTLAEMLYDKSQIYSIYKDLIDIFSFDNMLTELRRRDEYSILNHRELVELAKKIRSSMTYSHVESFDEMKERCFSFYEAQGDRRPESLNRLPKGILLSAGGNDLIDDALNLLLEYKDSSATTIIDARILDGVLYRMQRMLSEYVSAIESICWEILVGDGDGWGPCMDIPIFIHGYDYAQASGKGYRVVGVEFTGPWLEPKFAKKGHYDTNENSEAIAVLIDRFNDSVCYVAKKFGQQQSSMPVFFLDFRGEVKDGWRDEIHPNRSAFENLARKISVIISDFNGMGRAEFAKKYSPIGSPCIASNKVPQ